MMIAVRVENTHGGDLGGLVSFLTQKKHRSFGQPSRLQKKTVFYT